jgi:hypothetical protein
LPSTVEFSTCNTAGMPGSGGGDQSSSC